MLKPRIRMGANLFQSIKAMSREAEGCGLKLHRLSIGQPTGPAYESARRKAAELIMSDDEVWHEYQDNGCLPMPDFAERFVQAHVEQNLAMFDHLAYLPVHGIKSMLQVVIMAALQSADMGVISRFMVYTTTKPGYPTPADQCRYLENTGALLSHRALGTDPGNDFLFEPSEAAERFGDGGANSLIMMNYPGNPTGQTASVEWLYAVCAYCEENGVRLFNDAAYAALPHEGERLCTLADVAVHYPNLSWAEAFSGSKIGNFTGWRAGAMVGSADFIADIATVKGNTDSGFNAPLAVSILHVLENDRASLEATRQMYTRRVKVLTETLQSCGMELAVKPKAGFFTLWKCPVHAFGEKIESSEQFNRLMITKTGVVGVHFDPYMRYAVCGDVEAMIEHLVAAFKQANVRYK